MFNKPIILLFFLFNLTACGYNDLQYGDEIATSKWAEVLSQYQHRADLAPNLVNALKGHAAYENEVLVAVTEALAKVGPIQTDPEQVPDEAAFNQYVAAQSQLTTAISRLMQVTENDPNLKKDSVFREVRAQLEGIEKRITVARNRYIEAVNHYNQLVGSVPSSFTAIALGLTSKPNFTVENAQATADPSKVDSAAPVTTP